MSRQIIKLVILALVVAFIWYYFFPQRVELVPVAQLHTDEELPGTWWSVVTSYDHSISRDYNIKLPKIDFNKNYLLAAGGREIESLSYQRYTKWFCFSRDGYKGKAVFKKELHPHTIYVYKMKRIRLYNEDQWCSHFFLD